MSWSTLRQFPLLVWIVILGTFMVRTSFFMVWPFLSILLYREYDLSASGIGMLLGGAAVLSCLIGFYVGWLSDKIGRRAILLLGCAVSCGAYLLLGFGHSLWLIALGVFGSGLSYAFIDTPGKALMGDLLPEKTQRELAQHLRYFLLNVGAGVGEPAVAVLHSADGCGPGAVRPVEPCIALALVDGGVLTQCRGGGALSAL